MNNNCNTSFRDSIASNLFGKSYIYEIKTIRSVILILSSTLFLGCQRGNYNPSDFVKWVKSDDSGLKQTTTSQNFAMEGLYMPMDFRVANELKKNTISNAEYEEVKSVLGDSHEFKITISETSDSDLTLANFLAKEGEDRTSYLAFNMKNQFVLLHGEEQINPSIYHYEMGHDMAGKCTFLLGFNGFEIKHDITLQWMSPFEGIPDLAVQFSEENLNNIPKMKI